MGKFILVHNAGNSNAMVINTKNIVAITKSELLTGCSHIILNDLDTDVPPMNIHVSETPEKIYEMLK